MDTHVWPICLYSLTHKFIHSWIHWFIYINKHHNEEPLRPKNRSPICPKLYPLKGKKPTLSLKQDKVSELHCLLTGQCCLLAQTENSKDSGKRHAALWTPGSGLPWNETSPTLPLSAGHSMYVLGMGRRFSYPEWKSIKSSLVPAQGDSSQIWISYQHWIR